MYDVIIVGGGVVGLSCAWHLAQYTTNLLLLDRGTFGRNATWAAAGMLCPSHELEFTEVELYRAGLVSLEWYETWFDRFPDLGLNRAGAIEIALTVDDLPYLERVFRFQQQQGSDVRWLKPQEIRELEPLVSTAVPGGVFAPQDIQLDQRRLVDALVNDLRQTGVMLMEHTLVSDWREDNGSIIVQAHEQIECKQLLLCTGVYPAPAGVKIYPVKGQMLALEPHHEIKHTLRIRHRARGDGYIVPKSDRLLLGATSEEMGHDTMMTAGGVMDILLRSYQAVPALYEWPIVDMWAGLRPATLNRRPVVDVLPNGRVFVANGLYRHGILLAPLVGRGMATMMMEGRRPAEITSFQMSA